jgi:predicted ATP-dependent endonuclease of OLD family
MELLYLWLEKIHRIGRRKSVEFTGEYEFIIKEYNLANRCFNLDINTNEDFFKNIYADNIANITAIIGENGTGKTTFLEFLREFLSSKFNLGEKWIAIFKKDQRIVAYHTMYDLTQPETTKDPFFVNAWKINITIDKVPIDCQILQPMGIEVLSPSLYPIRDYENRKAIYYSGIFDLKGYPFDSTTDYIDISTNFLIEKDSEPDKNSLPNKSPILIHKHKNTLRQIKLVQLNASLLEKIDFAVPEKIEVVFENVNIIVNESRDISTNGKKLYEYFFNRLGKIEYPRINNIIKSKSNSESDIEKALKEKYKLRFVDAILNNYFKNIDHGEFWDKQLDVDFSQYDNFDVFSAVINFCENQKFINTNTIIDFVSKVFELFDNPENKTVDCYGENTLIINKKTDVIELLSLYEAYIGAIPYFSKIGFVEVQWRDLSSGQKAFLDLYSRLLFAKEKIRTEINEKKVVKDNEPETQTNIGFIYILLDEAEIGFHPEWQRLYLQYLHDFLQFLFMDGPGGIFHKAKVQIIITSHSPFLASDLPKSNIIFLKKSNDDLFNITSFSRAETFGSNIHQLYADSFVLQNGLIGEFAKRKIEDVIDYLVNPKSISLLGPESALKIINLIGEPIIKNRIMDLYKERFKIKPNSLEERKKNLEKELDKINQILKDQ